MERSNDSPVRRLLPTVLPALVVGIFSSLLLIGVDLVANWLETILWSTIPGAFGISGDSNPWILVILTVTGAAVGLVAWKVPGHAGPDPATVGLVEKPVPMYALPGLLLALILALAGGVSLGPENPIMALDIGVVYALGTRVLPAVGATAWLGLGTAGMIGAMFGTPVAAALLLSEAPEQGPPRPLWDRIFAPMVAAGAAALTTDFLSGGRLSLAVSLPPYPGARLPDLLAGSVIAAATALLGMAVVYAFRAAHPIFHRPRNPLLMTTVGGFLLGILGIVGGPITLFKGLDQMKELTQDVGQYTGGSMAWVALVKIAALVIAGTCGFRGGRIFPSVFIGVALGLTVNLVWPAVPAALAVSCALLGLLLAVTRQGWLSLFLAAVVAPDPALIPVMTVVMLPAWLLVTGRPEMKITPTEPEPMPTTSP